MIHIDRIEIWDSSGPDDGSTLAEWSAAVSPEEFEARYAKASALTVEELRTFRTVRVCRCGESGCHGWAMVSLSMIDEWDSPPYLGGRIPGSVMEGRP